MRKIRILHTLLIGSALALGSCEDLGTKEWPGSPTILSESELARNGFLFADSENSANEGNSEQMTMSGFEESSNWVGTYTDVRIINGGLVGTDSSALKIGPIKKENAEAILCMDFPIPESYDTVVLDARSRYKGLKISVGVGDYDGTTIYESSPIELSEDWQRGVRFDLRQQDGWRLRGEDIYSRSVPDLPISSLRIIVSGETDKNAAVADNITFK